MKLPQEIRESLVIAIDDYFETENDDPDAVSLAEACCRLIQVASEDADYEEVDDLVSALEAAAELEEGLHESLEFEFAKNDELELTGEDVVQVIVRVAGIVWTDDGIAEDELDSMDSYPDDEEDY